MKIIRTSTVGLSLNIFCKGLFNELTKEGYEVVALSSPDKDLKEVEEREGIRTIGVKMCRRISPLKDLKSLFKLIKVFRKEKPDMVHSITPKAGLLSMIAAKLAGVPVRLHTFTGLVFPTSKGIKRKLLLTTDRITCLCATHIMAEGKGVKSDLINNRVTRKNISVLGYGNIRGIDLNYYDRTPGVMQKACEIRKQVIGDAQFSKDTETSPFVFVFVGRLAADKGIDNLISAFSRLENEGRNVRLIMAGDFEPADPLKAETIDYIHSSQNVLFTGAWVDDVRPYLAAADALVFPSRREGFPNVVIEAGAMGLPSIVTDINGSNEIITDGLNGIIVPVDDTSALTEAIRRFVDNKEDCSKMAMASRKSVAERFEQTFVRTNLKNYYNSILS